MAALASNVRSVLFQLNLRKQDFEALFLEELPKDSPPLLVSKDSLDPLDRKMELKDIFSSRKVYEDESLRNRILDNKHQKDFVDIFPCVMAVLEVLITLFKKNGFWRAIQVDQKTLLNVSKVSEIYSSMLNFFPHENSPNFLKTQQKIFYEEAKGVINSQMGELNKISAEHSEVIFNFHALLRTLNPGKKVVFLTDETQVECFKVAGGVVASLAAFGFALYTILTPSISANKKDSAQKTYTLVSSVIAFIGAVFFSAWKGWRLVAKYRKEQAIERFSETRREQMRAIDDEFVKTPFSINTVFNEIWDNSKEGEEEIAFYIAKKFFGLADSSDTKKAFFIGSGNPPNHKNTLTGILLHNDKNAQTFFSNRRVWRWIRKNPNKNIKEEYVGWRVNHFITEQILKMLGGRIDDQELQRAVYKIVIERSFLESNPQTNGLLFNFLTSRESSFKGFLEGYRTEIEGFRQVYGKGLEGPDAPLRERNKNEVWDSCEGITRL